MAYKIFRGGKYVGVDREYTTRYTAVAVDKNGTKTIVPNIIAKNKEEALRKIKEAGFTDTPAKWVAPSTKFDTSKTLNASNINSVSEKTIDSTVGAKSVTNTAEKNRRKKKQ